MRGAVIPGILGAPAAQIPLHPPFPSLCKTDVKLCSYTSPSSPSSVLKVQKCVHLPAPLNLLLSELVSPWKSGEFPSQHVLQPSLSWMKRGLCIQFPQVSNTPGLAATSLNPCLSRCFMGINSPVNRDK